MIMIGKMRKQLARYEAVMEAYEERMRHKTDLINEQEKMLNDQAAMSQVIEECNTALANENGRMANEVDWMNESLSQLYAEWVQATHKAEEAEALERENFRLWQENVALRAALTEKDPDRAHWICGGK
ncbi:MAG: hypothetical protein IKS31_01505 [Clostridia bacterium]|nr:hypothetical protein [Clostridia bacterium]